MIKFIVKKRYYAIFCIKENSSFSIIKKKRLNNKNKTIRFNNKTFITDIEKPLYIKDNKLFYFFNYNSGNQLLFENEKSSINTDIIDKIVSQKIVSQLTANLNDSWKMNMLTLILGAVIGFMAGYIAYPFIFDYLNKDVQNVENVSSLLINSIINI